MDEVIDTLPKNSKERSPILIESIEQVNIGTEQELRIIYLE